MNKSSDSSQFLLFNLVDYHFACRSFLIMEAYIACCFCLIRLPFNQQGHCGGFWHHKMAARDLKSHPVLHRLLLSPHFFPCLLISKRQIQIWPKQTVRLGAVLGACRVSESTQMLPCLEELSVKTLPPNQSLMGLMGYWLGYENRHGEEIHDTRQLWLVFCTSWAILSWLYGQYCQQNSCCSEG